jgi:hypothetical protein
MGSRLLCWLACLVGWYNPWDAEAANLSASNAGDLFRRRIK